MKKIKVLMFGWEFPPHISGGLGTACLGLTKGLAKNEVEVLFVMPKASGDEDPTAARIINASEEGMLQSYTLSDQYNEHIQFIFLLRYLLPIGRSNVLRNTVNIIPISVLSTFQGSMAIISLRKYIVMHLWRVP